MDRGRRIRRTRATRRAVLATTLATAVTVTGVVLVPEGMDPAEPAALSTASTPTGRALLMGAVNVLEPGRETSPRPHQWIYTRSISVPADEDSPSENWRRVDGLREAYYLDGRLQIDRKGTRAVEDPFGAMPKDPAGMRAAIERKVREGGGYPPDPSDPSLRQRVFDWTMHWYWTSSITMPSRSRATVLRFVASIDGVRVTPMKDGTGRRVLAVGRASQARQILIDPTTLLAVGHRKNQINRPISAGKNRAPAVKKPPKTVTLTLTAYKIVDRPGRR